MIFFSELRPLLLIFLLSWNYKQIKELLRNSLLNQDQSNHFIANAEHFEIFGRTEKRNSGEDECYQFDNISEKVILTWKSLQIVIHLISPLKHREDVTKKNLQHVISGFNLNENTASLLSRNSIRVQCRVVSFFFVVHESSEIVIQRSVSPRNHSLVVDIMKYIWLCK